MLKVPIIRANPDSDSIVRSEGNVRQAVVVPPWRRLKRMLHGMAMAVLLLFCNPGFSQAGLNSLQREVANPPHSAGAPDSKPLDASPSKQLMSDLAGAFPPPTLVFPLYGNDPIPNSRPVPDQETTGQYGMLQNVSQPTLQVYLPAKAKANGTSIVIFPGGGYVGLSMGPEGTTVAQFFQDHGITAFVVKYRLPSDSSMRDKSIGPLQDAQQAIRFVRQHAKEWSLDSDRVGAIGFSAGGHVASTLGTHFEKSYIDNPDGVNLRPDYLILVYPVISMDPKIAHQGSRDALLGPAPPESLVKLFSSELQVTEKTPPTLLLQAADDQLVDVDNSIAFFEALRHHNVPVDMTIFRRGEHGFFLLSRDAWMSIIQQWMGKKGLD